MGMEQSKCEDKNISCRTSIAAASARDECLNSLDSIISSTTSSSLPVECGMPPLTK